MVRGLGVAAVLGVLGMFSAVSEADSETHRFWFYVDNPPTLSVKCGVSGSWGYVDVDTNACTTVCVRSRTFYRWERDCDGAWTKDANGNFTYDWVPSYQLHGWAERPCKANATGGLMKVKQSYSSQYYNCFNVSSHRGGYRWWIKLRPGTFECDDDAGCYSAYADVTVTTRPAERCTQLVRCYKLNT